MEVASTERILVIDDDPVSTAVLAAMLVDWGYAEVIVVNDSAAAAELCRREQPDLVLLDLQMPAPDGIELLGTLPSETRGVVLPVLVLTADASVQTRRRALAAGAQDFLTKPFDRNEIRMRVRNLLRTRRLATEVRRHGDELEQRVAQRTEELELARVEAIERLALAAEFREDPSGEHPRRVARTAELLGRAFLPADQLEALVLAAPLHDVGKLAIPDAILLKPDKLTRAEYAEVQRHVLFGERILAGSSSSVLQTAAQIALHHHERWDGRGYPAGSQGLETPLVARIVAVADVFDALTHHRPYREAWTVCEAVTEILNHSGGRFEPAIVDVFMTLDHESLVAPPGPLARRDSFAA